MSEDIIFVVCAAFYAGFVGGCLLMSFSSSAMVADEIARATRLLRLPTVTRTYLTPHEKAKRDKPRKKQS